LPDPETSGPTVHVDSGVSDLVPISGAIGLAPTRVVVLDVTVPPLLERARNPLDVLVANFGISMRLRPYADLGHNVTVHQLHAPDLGVRLSDFSHTADLIAAGRDVAQEALLSSTLFRYKIENLWTVARRRHVDETIEAKIEPCSSLCSARYSRRTCQRRTGLPVRRSVDVDEFALLRRRSGPDT
ncbi:MAG: hypothetical protein M3237_19800, partial [Actinomycetota bacterium]|nr:hypothetical protein [Actinomycetota bacterium]